MSGRDPVGFLLQFRDSLHISDSVALELVRLNLRLFRRNREAQMAMDSALRGVHPDTRAAQRGDSNGTMPAEVRERVDPLQARMRDQTAAVRDTAWSMLTPDQRNIATALELRLQEMMRRRNTGAPAGTAPTAPGRPD
jgi:hypothetical protein